MKKLLALLLIVCLLATSLFTVTAYADDEYNLQDVNKTAQYLAGWDVELDAGTLDYNCDGRVNLKDLVLIAQFVAGWNVVIGNGNNSIIPDNAYTQSVSATVTPVDCKVPAGGVVLSNGNISAFVPEGVLLNANTTTITLKITYLNNSAGGVIAGENEELVPVDVHIEGVSKANTVPIIIGMGKVLPEGLNLGNYKFFHVEDGEAKVMTLVDSVDSLTAHNTFTYDANTGEVSVAMATFSPVIVVYDTVNPWQGNEDASWYDASKTELTITNADQLYSFAKIVGGMAKGFSQDSFNGKIVKLLSDINLNNGTVVDGGISKIFYPVGYCNSEGADHYDDKTGVAITSGFYTFEGTFDGNGHTISNVYQNTWEMKGDHNWYAPEDQHYRDGMGIFGKVYGGTVKNLTVDNFESDGEITTTGVIAAYADGATFENIAITNCNPRVYNIGNGGIVGCVGWYAEEEGLKTTFKNITVDNSNKISALWGSYDVACGGIVGQYYPTSGQTSAGTPKNEGIHFENCHAAAQMDVYNDVCGNYQYYAYRYAGILMGSVRENVTGEDGHVYPDMTGITAENCTVHFGTWNDYYYCEFVKNGHPSYSGPDDYKFSRVPDNEIDTTKGKENATCIGHNHTDVEDNQAIYLPFNNLVTGYGWGVTSKAVGDMEGVTILDRDEAYSVEKFAVKENVITSYKEGMTVSVGKLFEEIEDYSQLVKDSTVQVFVSPVGEGSTANATYSANATNWEEGAITFGEGIGFANITITDYYFCTPITFTVNVTALSEADDYLNDYKNWNMFVAGTENEIPGEDVDGDGVVTQNISAVHDGSDKNRTIKCDSSNGRTDNSSIFLSFSGCNAYIKLPNLKPNTDYKFTFYYNAKDRKSDGTIFSNYRLFTSAINSASLGWRGDGDLYYVGNNVAYSSENGVFSERTSSYSETDWTSSPNLVVGENQWNKVEISFNSLNFNEKLFFCINNNGSTDTDLQRWIDDISLVEVNQNNSADAWSTYNFYTDKIGPNGTVESTNALTYNTTDIANIYNGKEGVLYYSSADNNSRYIATSFKTEKNKNYKVSIKYKSTGTISTTNGEHFIAQAFVTTVDGTKEKHTDKTGNVISAKCANYGYENKGNYLYTAEYKTSIDPELKDQWYELSLNFNSGENEELMFAMLIPATSSKLYITNFEVVEINQFKNYVFCTLL